MRKHLVFLLVFFGITVSCYPIYHKLGDYAIPGRIVSLDTKGTLVFSVQYSGLLEIIDISNPEQPQLSGSLQIADIVPGVSGKILVDGNLAFITGWEKVHIVNIAVPSNPVYAGSLPVSMPSDIVVSDSIAYVAGYYSLQVFDFSNLLSPVLLGKYDGDLDGLCKMNNTLYGVHSGSAGNLRIFDVTDPAHPVLLNENFNLPIYSAADIDGSDSVVYIAHGSCVWSISVKDPVHPFPLDTLPVENYADRISIAGTRAVMGNSNGFWIIGISDPVQMTKVSFYDTPTTVEDCRIAGGLAIVADSFTGVQIIDISDPVDDDLAGSLTGIGEAKGVAVKNSLAYVGNGNLGLAVVDVSDPAHPTVAGGLQCSMGSACNVSLNANKLVVGMGYPFPELCFIDIADPVNPVLVKSVAESFLLENLVLFQNDSVLFTGADNVMTVYSVSDFSHPAVIGQFVTSSAIRDIRVAGNFAYLALGQEGVAILDITSLGNPQLAGSFDTPGVASGLALVADTLIVADGTGGFLVCSVTDPHVPVVIGYVKPHPNSNVTLRPLILDKKLIIADQVWNELFVYDITNLSQPVLLRSARRNAKIFELLFQSGMFMSTNYRYGISLFYGSRLLSVDPKDPSAGEKNDAVIRPNPFSGNAFLTIPGQPLNRAIRFRAFNQAGRLILEKVYPAQQQTYAIDGNALSAGCYSFSVTGLQGERIAQGTFLVR